MPWKPRRDRTEQDWHDMLCEERNAKFGVYRQVDAVVRDNVRLRALLDRIEASAKGAAISCGARAAEDRFPLDVLAIIKQAQDSEEKPA